MRKVILPEHWFEDRAKPCLQALHVVGLWQEVQPVEQAVEEQWN